LEEDLYRLLKPKFEVPRAQYPGRIFEVKVGNTPPLGTRGGTMVIGGAVDLPFFNNRPEAAAKPHVAMQVQSPPQNIPQDLLRSLGELLNDPVEWAEYCAEKCKADAVELRFNLANCGVDQGLERVRELTKRLLRELDVPLIFSCPDSKELEPLVLETVAALAEGERVLLASARLDNEYARIAQAAISNQHVVLASTDCDPPSQKILNDKLLALGLPREQLVIDPTTAALGYGLEYSISIVEQIRINALKGDKSLQMPIAAFPANSWSAREANLSDVEEDSPPIGVMWELTSALVMFLAGADLLVMIHPESTRRFRALLSETFSPEQASPTECG
jgi:acetyl-CoA decarbonylase/synthase complex subunit delta